MREGNEAGNMWLEAVWGCGGESRIQNVYGWWGPDLRTRVHDRELGLVQEGFDEGYSDVHRIGQWRKNFLWSHVHPFRCIATKCLLGRTVLREGLGENHSQVSKFG